MFDGTNEHKDTNLPASSKTVDVASSENDECGACYGRGISGYSTCICCGGSGKRSKYGDVERSAQYFGLKNEHNPDGDC